MKPFVIVAFYKFITVNHYQALKEPLLAKMKALDLKGTVILAAEGINGGLCGQALAVAEMIDYLKSFSEFADLRFAESFDESNPYKKAKVKLREEIVSMGQEGINPAAVTGVHLSPEQWNALLSSPDVLLIDTRNDYEVVLGSFEGAINPQTENFRDFPDYVENHLLNQKDKKIAMFCTGGIRCEKSTAYLKTLGFSQVYQLDGGILNYLAQVPKAQSKWQGSCFVFDDRVALDHQLQRLATGTIDLEWKNNHKKKKREVGDFCE